MVDRKETKRKLVGEQSRTALQQDRPIAEPVPIQIGISFACGFAIRNVIVGIFLPELLVHDAARFRSVVATVSTAERSAYATSL
jgi:hypothetical protein